MQILLPNTNDENLNITSVELCFADISDEVITEQFLDELLSVANKYDTLIHTVQFNNKENK